MVKKILRYIWISLLFLLGGIVIFLFLAIGFVDKTPADEFEGYQETFQALDSVKISAKEGDSLFQIGYSKINLTPSAPVALAGYGNRKGKHYTSVADSIFISTMVIDNGSSKVAIVTADLLLIPPLVSQALARGIDSIGFSFENIYLGATHTHNSIGNWGEGAAGFIYGPYEQSMVDFITEKILRSIALAEKNKAKGKILYGKIAIPSAVENRLVKDGPEDPYMRVLEVQREDSAKLLLATYTAHATCLYSRDLELSRDYPGKFVDMLEAKGYTFAMFMAGSVGSHKPAAPEFGWKCFDWMADHLTNRLHESREGFLEIEGTQLASVSVPLHLSDPQVKVTENLKVRSWLFRSVLGEYPVHVNALRIGDVMMLGVPADFSGEFDADLDSVASDRKLNVMVTSFNGGYIGYLTPQKYYDNRYFETQLMNWYAPGTGEYVRDVMSGLIVK